MSEIDLSYIAGLFDGEGYFGVGVGKSKSSTFGFFVRPMFEFSLKREDSEYIIPKIVELLPDVKLRIAPTGDKTSIRLMIRRSRDLTLFLSKIKPFVQLPSVKKKIKVIEMIQEKKKFYKRLNSQETRELLFLVKDLRRLSRLDKIDKEHRSKVIKHDVDEILRNLPP